MFACYFLRNMKIIWLYIVSAPLLVTMGWLNLNVCQNFMVIKLFSYICGRINFLWVELKANGGVIFITILLHFHYFIFLETANTQKSGMRFKNFFSKCECISCSLAIIYNFRFRNKFSETLCKCIYDFNRKL